MKQKLFPVILLALLLAAAPVSAQGVRATGTAQMKNASTTEARAELKLEIVKRKASQTLRVMSGTVTRLENILARLESRIEKVKADGSDVVDSETFLAEAKKHLQMAKDEIALFVSIDFSTGTLRENFDKLKSAALDVKLHIREVHTNLMKSVRALRPGQANTNATTNATSTNQ